MSRCDICGAILDRCKITIDIKSYCGPETSGCFQLMKKTTKWKLSPAEALAMWEEEPQ
jgi:hypothetical protein